VVVILDGSERIQAEDLEILRRTKRRNSLVVVNKTDLPRELDREPVERVRRHRTVLEASALRGDGIERTIEAIGEALSNGNGAGWETPLVATLRHREILQRALKALQRAEKAASEGTGEELIAEDLRGALEALSEMTRQTSDQDVLDRIFSTFCVGK
jgi:tRNA modification GTPase